MTTRKKTSPPKESSEEDLLQRAAKAIGSALGTVALKTGIAVPTAAPPKATTKGKVGRAKKSASTSKATEPKTGPLSRKQQSSGELKAKRTTGGKKPSRTIP